MKIFSLQLFLVLIISTAFGSSSITLKAGSQQIIIDSKNIEWTDFCGPGKYSCMRFKSKFNGKKFKFGLLKVISDQIDQNKFPELCKSTFESTQKIEAQTQNFLAEKNASTLSCQWTTGPDANLLIWKNGVVLMASISDKNDLSKIKSIVEEARFYAHK